jgi:predicted transglutaminase-like cysteine proteinase
MGEGAPILAPFEHVRFCLRNATACTDDDADGPGTIQLHYEVALALSEVNSSVNSAIHPTYKQARSNSGWTINPSEGDCNDFAVTKQHELLRRGFPAKTLRLAVARTAFGEGHLVLIVRTNWGDLVLDNLSNSIRVWSDTDYIWLKRQSDYNSRLWVQIIKSPLLDQVITRPEPVM